MFLRGIKVLTDKVSGSLFVTSDDLSFVVARLYDQLNDWINDPEDPEFIAMAKAMKKKYDKYYGDPSKMNVMIYMGAIVDPKVKLMGLKRLFIRLYGREKAESLVNDLYEKTTKLVDLYDLPLYSYNL